MHLIETINFKSDFDATVPLKPVADMTFNYTARYNCKRVYIRYEANKDIYRSS